MVMKIGTASVNHTNANNSKKLVSYSVYLSGNATKWHWLLITYSPILLLRYLCEKIDRNR